jgi:peptidoglycan hydrolase-like protein with peptidoglycan-binding domain
LAKSFEPKPKAAWAAGASATLLGVLWAVPVIMLAVGVVGAKTVQQSSTAGATSGVVTVGSRQLDGRQAVTVTAHLGRVPEAAAEAQGTITAVNVAPGDSVSNGMSLLAVNGHALLAFSQSLPLFRDLAVDDTGDDVSALSSFLVTLHLLDENAADNHFGPQLYAAVTDFQRRFGYEVDGVFRPSYVVFVPTDFGEVTEVDAYAGQRLGEQSTLLKGTPGVTSLDIQPSGGSGPPSALQSESGLVVAIGDESTEISALPPTRPEIGNLWTALLAGAGRGDLKRTSSTTDAGTEAQFDGAHVARRETTTMGSVPASSIFTASDGQSCVIQTGSGSRSARTVKVTADDGEIGQALIDPSLIGTIVVRDVSKVDIKVLATCK